jgi:hypothetical protein
MAQASVLTRTYVPVPVSLNFAFGPQRRVAVGLASASAHPVRLVSISGTTGMVTKPQRDDKLPSYAHSAGGSVVLVKASLRSARWYRRGDVFLASEPVGLKLEGLPVAEFPLAIKGRVGNKHYSATSVFSLDPAISLVARDPVWLIFTLRAFERASSTVNITLTGLTVETEGIDEP